MSKVESIIGDLEFERKFDPPTSYERAMRFMLSCLNLVRHRLPDIAQKKLAIAEQHWSGNPQDLEAARVACWQYLKKTGQTYDYDRPGTAEIRAVIYVLCPDPDPVVSLAEILEPIPKPLLRGT